MLGENYKHKTQFLWVSIVNNGVSVCISQSLIVESPDPLAQFKPSGENYVQRTLLYNKFKFK